MEEAKINNTYINTNTNVNNNNSIVLTSKRKKVSKPLYKNNYIKKSIRMKFSLSNSESFTKNHQKSNKVFKISPTLIFPPMEQKEHNSRISKFSNDSLTERERVYSLSTGKRDYNIYTLTNNTTQTATLDYNFTASNFYKNSVDKKINEIFNYRSNHIQKLNKIKVNSFKKRSKTKPKIDFFDFGPDLKLYSNNNIYNRKLEEKRNKKRNELFFDYDKNNNKIKFNSFTGNGASLLRNKVHFVKGVIDFVYPKFLLKKVTVLKQNKEKDFEEEMKNKGKNQEEKYFLLRHRTVEQKSKLSKYSFGGVYLNEDVKRKGNFIKTKKCYINRHVVYKYVKDFNFK